MRHELSSQCRCAPAQHLLLIDCMLSTRIASGQQSRLKATLGVALGLVFSAAGIATTVAGDLRETSQAEAAAALIAREIAAARADARDGQVYIRLRLEGNRLVRESSTDGTTFEPERVLLTLPEGVSATLENRGRKTG
jgi:hypothetical protein